MTEWNPLELTENNHVDQDRDFPAMINVRLEVSHQPKADELEALRLGAGSVGWGSMTPRLNVEGRFVCWRTTEARLAADIDYVKKVLAAGNSTYESQILPGITRRQAEQRAAETARINLESSAKSRLDELLRK